MHKGFFKNWNNSELRDKFDQYIERENGKRFIMLLSIVSLSQVLLVIAEAIGLLEWDIKTFYSRILVFSVSSIFAYFVCVLRGKLEKENHLKVLSTVKAILHLFILAIGCYFTTYMFENTAFTYSPFIITVLLISVTHVRWPIFSNILLLATFVGLCIYIDIVYIVPSYFVGESITASILVALVSIVNILNYRRLWSCFVQEEEIKAMNEKLRELSQKDELTGLFNRRRVLEELDEFISLYKRYKIGFSVTMLDLDHFKMVNDKYGHNTGDDVLREFSKVFTTMLRDSDIFGRWGGEEFIIVTPNTHKNGAFMLIDRAREKIEKYEFEGAGNITFSAGVCEFEEDYTAEKIVDNADFALYLSKQMGRNKVSIFANEKK